jgi:integrase
MKGHIRSRGKNKWAIVIDRERDADGKRRQQWITVNGTKRDAERELAKFLHEFHTGQLLEPNRQTLGEFLVRWLQDCAVLNIQPKTHERYAEIIRTHLVPQIGQVQLSKLRPEHIQKYYADALRAGRRDGKGGLSPSTVLYHHRVLRCALQQAVSWRLLPRNPADEVTPPRASESEMRALSEEEANMLLEVAKESPHYTAIVLAITTGLRRGELAGLRWQDIDLTRRHLTVHQAVEVTKAGGFRFKEPKTAGSRRTILLPAMAVEALKHHRAEQAQQRLMFGPGYQDHGLVLAGPDGTPCNPMALTKCLKPLLKKAGLPRIRLHELRHTHASQLINLKIDPLTVSKRLAHSKVSTTMDIYGHLMPGAQEQAMEQLDAVYQAARVSARRG